MIDPKTLSAEERAIVEETVTANVSFDGLACDLFWDKCYEFAIQRILARRALFGEPASEPPETAPCPNCKAQVPIPYDHVLDTERDGSVVYTCHEPASEGAKVECPNCGQPGEHYHSGDMPHVPAFYTCQPAQPEPAAPVGEMFPAMRAFLDASPVQRTIGQWHAADNELKAAHAAQPKVAMTEELETVMVAAQRHAVNMQICGSVPAGSTMVVPETSEQPKSLAEANRIQVALAAVRAQAAGVKLEKVRALLMELEPMDWPSGEHAAALAELDAAEGLESNNKGDL